MKRHFFIDMDGTLTRSRTEISTEMLDAVQDILLAVRDEHNIQIKDNWDVVIVSGASMEQIEKQCGSFLSNKCFKLAQNGNDGFGTGHEWFWSNTLTWLEKHDIMYWCWEMLHRMNTPKDKWLDAVQDRGCQISYSLVGHNAPLKEKEAFDPDGSKRRDILEALPFLTMSNTKVDVVIGGTTCFDFFREGCNKGANVERMIKEMEWKKEDCIYIGDALYKGGNDESVMGIGIETVGVAGPEDTLKVLKERYGDQG